MNGLEKTTEEMVKEISDRIMAEIEEFAKGLIFVPQQTFPIAQTYNNGNERIAVTYHQPDNEGNILCEITQEIKTIEIEVKYGE